MLSFASFADRCQSTQPLNLVDRLDMKHWRLKWFTLFISDPVHTDSSQRCWWYLKFKCLPGFLCTGERLLNEGGGGIRWIDSVRWRRISSSLISLCRFLFEELWVFSSPFFVHLHSSFLQIFRLKFTSFGIRLAAPESFPTFFAPVAFEHSLAPGVHCTGRYRLQVLETAYSGYLGVSPTAVSCFFISSWFR